MLSDLVILMLPCLPYLVISGKFLFFIFAALHGMWDLVPSPGIEPMSPAVEVQSLNHWTAREVPGKFFTGIHLGLG